MKYSDYIEHLRYNLKSYLDDNEKKRLLQAHLKDLFVAIKLDFDPVTDILNSLYSPVKRRTPREPDTMLRSLILMTLNKISGITNWVENTRTQPLFAILAGFNPDNTPGVGTYYDFINRLIDGPYKKPCEHIVKRSTLNSGKHLRNLKKEKMEKEDTNPNQPLTEKLVDELLANKDIPRPDNFYKILEDLMIKLAITPSMEQNCLDLKDLAVVGDGSILETDASPHPKTICDCRSKGVYRCDCERYYTSVTATWCYDHYRDTFVFGDRYYHLVAYQNSHDLPLITLIPGGNESDYTLSLRAFDEFLKACHENGLDIHVKGFGGDGHHDSYAHYRYFAAKGVIPVIPLSENSKKTFPYIEGLRLNGDGWPLCPGGGKMRHHQYNSKRHLHVYACPIKRGTHKDGIYKYIPHVDECPQRQDCAPLSPIGPLVYISNNTNPRLYPPIPRSSERFKEIQNQRSATERENHIKKDVYKLVRACRSADHMQFRLTLVDILRHTTLWYHAALKNLSEDQLLKSCMEKLSIPMDTS